MRSRKIYWSNSKRILRARERGIAKRRRSHKRRLAHFKMHGLLREFKDSSPLIIKNFARVKMPQNFSLINNPINVLSCITTLTKHLESRRSVFVNLKDVNELSTDAIVLLASVLDEFKTRGIKFNGNFPKDPILRDKFEASGFFQYLYNLPMVKETESHLYGHNDLIVKSDLAAEVIKKATKTVSGIERDNIGIFRALVEIMTNTHNWAAETEGVQKWWLLVEHDHLQRIAKFSFLDNGVGILKSIDKRAYKQGISESIKSIFKNNPEILMDVLEGKIKSKTGLSFRGKGLPGIYNAFKGNFFSNFTLITNNVSLNLQTGSTIELPQDFTGTFFYFELSSNNIIN